MATTLIRVLAGRFRRATDLVTRRWRLEFLLGIRLTADGEREYWPPHRSM
jgi:hypothetical protein